MLLKMTDHVLNHRPAWYFDVRQQREGELMSELTWSIHSGRYSDQIDRLQTRHPDNIGRAAIRPSSLANSSNA